MTPSVLAAARRLVPKAPGLSRQEHERAAGSDARILTLFDTDYPAALLDLELPPPVLYLRGQLPRAPGIAIVGSRNADAYGLEASRRFASELAAAGATVVSGFARGIDAAAHRATLDQERGTTVAVLGCGLGVTYPRHYRMLDEIAERGAALSEFPCGWGPKPANFPIRNRLIAALSYCTLVVQASQRSGALITARLAAELGRDVFAVPGRIFEPRSAGANALLRDGAQVALDPQSVLEGLPLAAKERLQQIEDEEPEGSLQRRVLERLECGAATSEELARPLGLGVEEVLVTLLDLELRGRVVRYGPRYSRR